MPPERGPVDVTSIFPWNRSLIIAWPQVVKCRPSKSSKGAVSTTCTGQKMCTSPMENLILGESPKVLFVMPLADSISILLSERARAVSILLIPNQSNVLIHLFRTDSKPTLSTAAYTFPRKGRQFRKCTHHWIHQTPVGDCLSIIKVQQSSKTVSAKRHPQCLRSE